MYPCAYPPPTDAELWLRDIKSAWLRAPWVLDTVTDAAFREKTGLQYTMIAILIVISFQFLFNEPINYLPMFR